ncbi:hypothetical protein [Flagellimonas eckloniae]|uniref:TonB-dependent receptor plug domain-containing protein n=1 Tax=Flagellimonas eckloniae TaxID=346185 RepID=A0A0Q0XPQ6_9FLAO|nr:hypothetical protein [Allomuricauda eckloniae]KQC31086.1 hypothetical protein AAY42_15175 [Allomuricauda eckloniae]
MKSFNRLILSTLCLLGLFSSFGQEANKKQLPKDYKNYFSHFREAIHLHLNKTTYFVGEEIWWTAYAYNKKTNSPSLETANLYCGLYDKNGKQIRKELFLLKDGVGQGNFKVDSTLSSGIYFIKAGTKWMKNFDEDLPFFQSITIINKPLSPRSITSSNHDLQILPEGGHIISNVENMIGIRLIDENGRGVPVKGDILNGQGNVVTSFYTNEYGVGKFKLDANPNESYKVKITLDNKKTIEKLIPKSKEKGIAMAINNILEDKLVISIRTNNETLKDILNNPFHIAVHRDGIMTLNSFNLDSVSRTIKIDKKKLLPGMNIITLFDSELIPISERLTFNYKNANIASASVKPYPGTSNDSVSIKVNTFSKKNTSMSLSVSVLPKSTVVNNTDTNIVSNFLLTPYLQLPIENSSRYFSKINRTKEYELDLILLTQGWSRYKWDSIFNKTPEIKYPFEFGISAIGRIDTKMRNGEALALIQNSINSMFFLELKDSINFTLTNLLLENGDKMKFSIKKKSGGLRRPKLNIDFQGLDYKSDSIPLFLITNHLHARTTIEQWKVTEGINLIKPKDLIKLDEVILTEEKIENKLTRKSPLIDSSFRGVKIDEKELRRSPLLTDLIARNGFRVIVNPRGRGEVLITNIKPFVLGPVRIYENDIPVLDSTQLLNIPLNQIDEVYFETDGMAADINASGGAIRIYRKEGTSLKLSSSRFAEKLVKNSFTKPKEFYRPKYTSSIDQNFTDFGIVHWEPQLLTNKKGEATLTIPDDKLPAITLFIEGIGEDGSLLSHTQEISLN